MTNRQPTDTQKRFVRRVEHYLEGISHVSFGGMLPDCDVCDYDDGWCPDCDSEVCYCADEGSFSRYGCEICGSPLGGDRHIAHGFTDDDELVHLSGCTDCLYFLTYGDLPEGL